MTENFFDILGVLTALISVMLVFSIAITALVQATQGLFRWRARNLQNSLATILAAVQQAGSTDDASKNAITLINKSDSALLSKWFNPDSWPARILGPQVSWMSPEELDKELLKNEINLDPEQSSAVSEKYRTSQGTMCKVFLRRIRITTIFWAVAIAFYYQLSTPQLLHDFSVDPKLRAAAEATGDALLKSHGGGSSATDAQQAAGGQAEDANKRNVAYFELAPWRDSWAFYCDIGNDRETAAFSDCKLSNARWDRVIGVLMTVILLSMGAPFWFDMLKSVANLRDTLAPDKEQSLDKSGKDEPRDSLASTRIKLLQERMLATDNPVLKASLQKEINDLRVVNAENP